MDFDALERHGIFRDMPVEYKYDDNSNRLIDVSDVSVTDGSAAIPFETSDTRPNMRIKVGDPDKLVSSRQRYVISYTVHDGLNPFPDHDELFWNVTGNDWPVAVEALRQQWWRPSLESSVSPAFRGLRVRQRLAHRRLMRHRHRFWRQRQWSRAGDSRSSSGCVRGSSRLALRGSCLGDRIPELRRLTIPIGRLGGHSSK